MNDTLISELSSKPRAGRETFELEDTGFDELPVGFRKFYRRWAGPGDELGANEVLCPVCQLVIRSRYELAPGDQLYCMPCFTRLDVVRGPSGRLEAITRYS